MCSLNTPVDAPPVSDAENVSASAPGTLQSLTYINFRSRASAVLHDHADVQRLDRTRAHLSCASRGNHKSRSRRRTHTHRGRIRKPRHRDLDLRTALLRVLPATVLERSRKRPSYSGIWCRWRESNPHSLRNTILSRARLPVPPHRLGSIYSRARVVAKASTPMRFFRMQVGH